MIKMKKKWLRGGVSLALVAALSLSSAVPVWAAEGDPVISSLTNSNQSESGRVYSPAETVEIKDTNSTKIVLDNKSDFTISVPKSIYIKDKTSTGNITLANTAVVKVKDCDIGPGQKVTAGVKKEITLNNGGISGAVSKKINATFTNSTAVSSSDEKSVEVEIVSAGTDSMVIDSANSTNDSKADDAIIDPAQIQLSIPTAIHAGVWYGTMEFYASLNQTNYNPNNPGNPASLTY